MLVLSTQIDYDIYNRYRLAGWAILTGKMGGTTTLESTYMFMRDVVGYDLAGFFERNHQYLREEIEKVLVALLKTS